MSQYDLRVKIDTIYSMVNKMEPMVADLLENFKAMDARQRFLETTVGKHEAMMEFYTKDINSLGAEVKDLRIKQLIRSAAQPGESEKWTSFLEFMAGLPKYIRAIAPWIATLISVLAATMMGMYQYLKHRIHP